MLRQFLRDAIIYGAANFLTRGINFILLPIYTRWLTPADYGVIDTFAIFQTLISLTVPLEIGQGFARYFPEASTTSERQEYAASTLLFTIFVYSIFLAAALLLPGVMSATLLDSPERVDLARLMAVAIWFNGLFYFVQSHLRWGLNPRGYAITSILFSLVAALAAIVAVTVLRLGVTGVLYGQLTGSITAALLGFYFVRGEYRLVFSVGKLRHMLAFSVPLVPSSIGVFLASYVDRIAIKEILSLSEMGLFGVGYRIASIVSLALIGFQNAITPILYTRYEEAGAPRELARIFRYFSAFALLLFMSLSMFAPELMVILTAPEYYPAASVVPILVPALLFSGMYIFAPGLSIQKKTGAIAIINILGGVLNTGLNLLLIPLYGITGSALATLISAFCAFSLNMIYSQRSYFVPHQWRTLIASMAVAGIAVWLGSQIHAPLLLALALKVPLILLAAALIVALRLVTAAEILQGLAAAARRLGLVR